MNVAEHANAAHALVVSEIMTAPVVTLSSSANAHEATEVMRARHVQHLVVVDELGRVEGVLSDGDIRSAQPSMVLVPDARMREKALTLIRVRDIMSRHPHLASPDWPAKQVLERMRGSKIGSIPVVDDLGRPVGIVTGMDVIVLALRLLRESGR